MTDVVLEEFKKAVSDCDYDTCFDYELLSDNWEEVDSTAWTQYYKYQFSTTYFRHIPSNRVFAVEQARSGSYHTDWYYNQPDCIGEVVKVKKVIETEEWELLQ